MSCRSKFMHYFNVMKNSSIQIFVVFTFAHSGRISNLRKFAPYTLYGIKRTDNEMGSLLVGSNDPGLTRSTQLHVHVTITWSWVKAPLLVFYNLTYGGSPSESCSHRSV